jgi:DNA repair exonuclease SbcCD ATPase subunit
MYRPSLSRRSLGRESFPWRRKPARLLRVENGSDLRSRQAILEQRVTTLAESLQRLIKIVRDVSWELSGVISTLNDDLEKERAEDRLDTRALSELSKRLERLDSAIEKLGEP